MIDKVNMANKIKFILILSFLTCNLTSIQAVFLDMFFDDADLSDCYWGDDFERLETRYQERENYWKERRELLNKRKQELEEQSKKLDESRKLIDELSKIKPTMQENDGKVIIEFDINNLNKDNVSTITIDDKNQVASGSISMDCGTINYQIYPKDIVICRYIEIKQESKEEVPSKENLQEGKTIDSKENKEEKRSVSSTYNYAYFNNFSSEKLPIEVDLNNIDLITKDSKVIITISGKTYKEVTPRHVSDEK